MNLARLIARYPAPKFAISLSAIAETGGSFELAICDQAPLGQLHANLALTQKLKLKGQPLSKGCLKTIENHTLQSGVLALAEHLLSDTVDPDADYLILDGVHLTLEIYWQGQFKRITRFHDREEHFQKLCSSILKLSVAEAPELQPATRLL